MGSWMSGMKQDRVKRTEGQERTLATFPHLAVTVHFYWNDLLFPL